MIPTLLAQVQDLKDAAPTDSLTLDSAILTEQFYFFTVVIMWLIHAGFMSYEAGVTTAIVRMFFIAVAMTFLRRATPAS